MRCTRVPGLLSGEGRGTTGCCKRKGSALTGVVWMNPRIVEWSQRLLDSYRHWIGRDLIERVGEPEFQSCALFESPFGVLSHGSEAGPILDYGRRTAMA